MTEQEQPIWSEGVEAYSSQTPWGLCRQQQGQQCLSCQGQCMRAEGVNDEVEGRRGLTHQLIHFSFTFTKYCT